jgi:hypothetical protein
VWGVDLDIDGLLTTVIMKPLAVFQKGKPRSEYVPQGKLCAHFGANFEISSADFSKLSEQVRDAVLFLKENREDILKVRAFPGIDGMTIDFAANIDPERFPCSFNFSNELLISAGSLGVSLELSIYPD